MGTTREIIEYVLNLSGDLPERARGAGRGLADMAVSAGRAVASAKVLASAMTSAAKATYELVAGMADLVDQTVTLSASTGLATDTIGALRLAAGATGKDIKDLIPPDLAKRIAETAAGTGRAKVGFEGLGLASRIVSGDLSSADDVLRATIDALIQVEDPTRRAALATQALGQQGKQLLSALSSSDQLDAYIAATEAYGTRIGPEAVALTGEWQVATASLGEAFIGLRLAIFQAIGPEVVRAIHTMADAMQVARDLISDWRGALDSIASPLDAIRRGALATATAIRVLVEQGGGIGRVGGQFATVADAFTRGAAAFRGETLNLKAALDGSASSGGYISDEILQADGAIQSLVDALADGTAPAGRLAESMGRVATATGRARDYMAALARELRAAEEARVAGMLDQSRRASAVFQAQAGESDTALADMVAALEAALIPALERQGDRIATSQQMLGAGAPPAIAAALAPALAPIAALTNIQGTLTRATAIVEGIPDLLASIPDLAVSLIDAVAELPARIVERLPEILLGLAKAIGRLVTAPFRLFAELLGSLPQQFAEALAELLKRGLDKVKDGIQGAMQRAGAMVGVTTAAGSPPTRAASLPSYDTGAYVTQTGVAMVHAGERVLNREEVARGAGGGVTIGAINIRSTDPREAAREVMKALSPYGGGGRLAIGGL